MTSTCLDTLCGTQHEVGSASVDMCSMSVCLVCVRVRRGNVAINHTNLHSHLNHSKTKYFSESYMRVAYCLVAQKKQFTAQGIATGKVDNSGRV